MASLNNQLWRRLAAFVTIFRSANREQLEDAIDGLKQASVDYGLPNSERAIYRSLIPILRKELKGYVKNPARRKPAPRRKKVARKKNPNSLYSVVFAYAVTTRELFFMTGYIAGKKKFSKSIKHSLLFRNKKAAIETANLQKGRLIYGVANYSDTPATIKKEILKSLGLSSGK